MAGGKGHDGGAGEFVLLFLLCALVAAAALAAANGGVLNLWRLARRFADTLGR